MNSILLERDLRVCCWRVIGEVARSAKRAELMPVLQRAREQGKTDADDIAGHLLFDPRSRKVVAQRLLKIAALYGLLAEQNNSFVLTEEGKQALSTEQVFVPEHGTWSLWATEDPLVPGAVLRVEPWKEPTAYDEVWGRDRDMARERSFEKMPRWLMAAVGSTTTVDAPDGAKLRINHLEDEGEAAEPASLQAAWDVTGGRLRLAGALGASQAPVALDAPRRTAEEVWRQLLESERLWPQWDETNAALRLSYDETTPQEREAMSRDVLFRQPRIKDLGEFGPVTVPRVPLRARTASDAAHWAEWRLRERVRDYATGERFGAWTADATKPFRDFAPPVPTRRELASKVWPSGGDRPSPMAWRLAAAEDWGF